MNFNQHSELVGLHAFLSPSKYHWINYDKTKLEDRFLNYLAVERGNKLHEFAKHAINLGMKLEKNRNPINQYVNDAIGYGMVPEQVLFYSPNSFGTADTISFRRNLLRIHDLKTGSSPVSIHQLEVYAALFCLEYNKKPEDIDIELRIYQTEEIFIEKPKCEFISHIMSKIVEFDLLIERMKLEAI